MSAFFTGRLDRRTINRIDRLKFRLQTRPAHVQALQQRCSVLLHQQLNAQLAKVFEQACSLFKGHLLIDALVLKIGTLTPAQFENQFVHRIIRELEQQLALLLSSSTLPKADQVLHLSMNCTAVLTNVEASSAMSAPSLLGQQESILHLSPATELPIENAKLLDDFLRTGRLREPLRWHKAGGADAWLGQLLVSPASSLLTVLAQACLMERSLQRLMQGFDSVTLQRLVTLLATAAGRPLQTLPSMERSSFVLAALMYFQRHPQVTISAVDKVLLGRLSGESLRLGDWLTLQAEDVPRSSLLSDWLQEVRELACMERLRIGIDAEAGGTQAQLKAAKSAGPRSELSPNPSVPMVESENCPASEFIDPPATCEVEVCNAGVILLWPLLARLFTECGWLQREEGIGRLLFVDASARQAAVCLLDHLTWDEGIAEEWRCVLNKWLCGVPFEQVLDPLQLSQEVLGVGERYLEMFHTQVAALNRCSLTDVRAMFLQRPGLLTKTGSDWRLQVQTDPSDILLSDIPWPMGEVMLPWLETTLPIEWLRN